MSKIKFIEIGTQKLKESEEVKNLECLSVLDFEDFEKEVLSFIKDTDAVIISADTKKDNVNKVLKNIEKLMKQNNVYSIYLASQQITVEDIKELFIHSGNIKFECKKMFDKNGALTEFQKAEFLNPKALFISVVGGNNMKIADVGRVAENISKKIAQDTPVVANVVVDDEMKSDEMEVALIATGCN